LADGGLFQKVATIIHTQPSLSAGMDMSRGKTNYVLGGLTDKGLIEPKKLKNHPDHIRWRYILTPKGMKEKIVITKNYLNKRLKEFDVIEREIAKLRKEIAVDGGDDAS